MAFCSSLEIDFISLDSFGDYLEELDYCEVPETLLLQKFDKVAAKMSSSYLAIQHWLNGYSNFEVSLEFLSLSGDLEFTQVLTWSPENYGRGHSVQELEIRFFYFDDLMDIVESYLTKNIPGEFWLKERTQASSSSSSNVEPSVYSFMRDASLQAQLAQVIDHISARLVRIWDALFEPGIPAALVDFRARQFFWLLEEWCLAHKMKAVGHDDQQPQQQQEEEEKGRRRRGFSFPSCLVVPTTWSLADVAKALSLAPPSGAAADQMDLMMASEEKGHTLRAKLTCCHNGGP